MSVTVQAIPQEPSPPGLNNEFYVPNILSFNLKKTPEDRLQAVETDSPSSRQNDDPFLTPVEHTIESNKENPVLKALLHGKTPQSLSQWHGATRPTLTNCHPFKKTEFSHDLAGDNTPVQVPKSLIKKGQSMQKTREKTGKGSDTKMATVLKEIKMNSNLSITSASGLDRRSVEKEAPPELSIFNRKKKITSQSAITQPNKPRIQYVNSERLIQLRTLVDNAIKNHKVYSMTGCYTSVRNALKQRGWIEKIDNDVKGRRKVNRYEEVALCQGEAEIINKMLKNVTEDLCWLSRPYPYYCWKDFDKFEMVNRLPRAYFSNKVGLCNSLQQIQWFYETGVCSTRFPRTYNMSTADEVEAFKEDYRLTACIGILKWFINAYRNGGERAVRSPEGKVEMNVVEFALRRCVEFVRTKQHEDIDILETPTVWEYQWDQFITQFYRIVNEGQILKDDKESISIKALVSNVQSMLNILKPHWPQFDIEGYQNYWIVKPGGRCCGAGIVIKNNLEQILIMVNPNSMKETRFIVQKYIERPLLIYNTKFDIRQWFLVTNVYPLTIWMYKESYLRFCSQPFSLKNTHESIHLCNNAVQRKYKNAKRDRGLPEENMWDCYTFQTYLKAIGHPEAWEKYIYPGMKEGFIGALLASQESMERKKNCFELYGADFMITECLSDGPWLIEINSNPAMDSSTSVTARLCPQVLEDIIKVVIDRRDNKSAPTGSFEMVFRQNCPPVPSYLGISLCVKGKKAFKCPSDGRAIGRKSKTKKSSESVQCTDTEEESTAEEIFSVSEAPQASPDTVKKDVESLPRKTMSTDIVKEMITKKRKIDWVRKNIDDLKGQSVREVKTSPQPTTPITENKKEAESEHILRSLEATEINKLIKQLKMIVKEDRSHRGIGGLIIGGMERMKRNSDYILKEKFSDCPLSETLSKTLQMCRERTDDEIPDGLTTKTKSCPNFDLEFERELEKTDKKLEKAKPNPSTETFYSARSTTSIDYFRDWKSKLYETRKTCEDLLVQLQTFKETNSKVKFQEAVSKRLKDELDFVKRIKQRRKTKTQKTKKDEKYKPEDYKSKFWQENGGLAPLAINSENGAVRNIGYSLAKIKQRSRPPLPNGSSEHGRKIDVSLEQTCCH